jgi:hypothetical protein
MEEVEAIRTAHPAFRAYLAIVAEMLRHQSNELYVGPVLAAMVGPHTAGDEAQVCSNRVSTLPVSNADAASMFALNVQAWRSNAFIQQHYERGEITELARRLTALARDRSGASGITWELRQIALHRRGPDA